MPGAVILQLGLRFSPTEGDAIRRRLSYAFAVFCSIFGHEAVFGETRDVDVELYYGAAKANLDRREVGLAACYKERPLSERAPDPTTYQNGDIRTVLIHGVDKSGKPDWLAEIFEWLSCADEYSLEVDPDRGAVDPEDCYLLRHRLDPFIPYAAVAMHGLQQLVRVACPSCPEQPPSALEGVKHIIAVTHDVDYLPGGRLDAVVRVLRNSAAALVVHRRPVLAARLGVTALSTVFGKRNPLDQIGTLVTGEVSRGWRASYFFIPRRLHRRDANYSLENSAVPELMGTLQQQGMDVGSHGSYRSLDESGALASEVEAVERICGRQIGNRQHWLRYELRKLIPELEAAGALYDSSIGWSRTAGFRAGACFPFPLYNFAEERPTTFVELPLVAMDVGLVFGRRRISVQQAYRDLETVLANSRRYGWGGIAILWHPTGFGGGQIPAKIGTKFWQLAAASHRNGDRWMSCREVVECIGPRYRVLRELTSPRQEYAAAN